MANLTLRQTLNLNDALSAVENVSGFSLDTSWKLAVMKGKTDDKAQTYVKERNKRFLDAAIQGDISKLQLTVDYVNVPIKSSYSVPVKVSDYERIDEELGDLLDKEMVFIKDKKFKLADFEKESSELSEDGKKQIKKRVLLVTPSFLRVMAPFIEEFNQNEEDQAE